MAEKLDLSKVLGQFKLDIAGPSQIQRATGTVESSGPLVRFEEQIVEQLRREGQAIYQLSSQEAIDFTSRLGPSSTVILAGGRRPDGKIRKAYATVTPDSRFVSSGSPLNRLGFAALMKKDTGEVQERFDPHSRIRIDQPAVWPKVWSDVLYYLSGANQLTTVPKHEPGRPVLVNDPNHVLSVINSVNEGSYGESLVKAIVDPKTKSHVADVWDGGAERSLLRNVSAQDLNRPDVDLIQVPVTFTPVINNRQPSQLTVVIPRFMVDEVALTNGHIATQKADEPGALEQLQDMALVSVGRRLGQRGTDNFRRVIDQVAGTGGGYIN